MTTLSVVLYPSTVLNVVQLRAAEVGYNPRQEYKMILMISDKSETVSQIRTSDDVEAIPFPTISLCNINKIRKDYLDKNEKLQ